MLQETCLLLAMSVSTCVSGRILSRPTLQRLSIASGFGVSATSAPSSSVPITIRAVPNPEADNKDVEYMSQSLNEADINIATVFDVAPESGSDPSEHVHDAEWSQVQAQIEYEAMKTASKTFIGKEIPSKTAHSISTTTTTTDIEKPESGDNPLTTQYQVPTTTTWTLPWYEEEPSWHPSSSSQSLYQSQPTRPTPSTAFWSNSSTEHHNGFINHSTALYSMTLPRTSSKPGPSSSDFKALNITKSILASSELSAAIPFPTIPPSFDTSKSFSMTSQPVQTSASLNTTYQPASQMPWIWREDAKPSFVTVNVTVTQSVEGSATTVSVIPMVSVSLPSVPMINSLQELSGNTTADDPTIGDVKDVFTPEEYQTIQDKIANLNSSLILPEGEMGNCQPLPDDPCVNASGIMNDPDIREAIEEQDQKDQERKGDDHKDDEKGQDDENDKHKRKDLATILGTSLGIGIPASTAIALGLYHQRHNVMEAIGRLLVARLPTDFVNKLDQKLPAEVVNNFNLPRYITPTVLDPARQLNPKWAYPPWEYPNRSPTLPLNPAPGGSPGSPPLPGDPGIPPPPAIYPPTPISPVPVEPGNPLSPPSPNQPVDVPLPKSPDIFKKCRTPFISEIDPLGEPPVDWKKFPTWGPYEDEPVRPLNGGEWVDWAKNVIRDYQHNKHAYDYLYELGLRHQAFYQNLNELMREGWAKFLFDGATDVKPVSTLQKLHDIGPRVEHLANELRQSKSEAQSCQAKLSTSPPSSSQSQSQLAECQRKLTSTQDTSKDLLQTKTQLDKCKSDNDMLRDQQRTCDHRTSRLKTELDNAKQSAYRCRQKLSADYIGQGGSEML